jgi:hypothetical protein
MIIVAAALLIGFRADLGPSSRGIPQTTPRAIRLLTNEMAGAPPAPLRLLSQAGLIE